jgi:uncharacterized membrane protein YgcG
MPRPRHVFFWPHIRCGAVTLLTLASFFPLAAGCVSNQYVIPRDELMRQAQLPIAARGQRVRVVQDLGNRRGDPVPPTDPSPPLVEPQPIVEPPPDTRGDPSADSDVDTNANLQIDVGNGSSSDEGRAPRRMPAPDRPSPARASGGWHPAGSTASTAGGHVGGWHGGAGGAHVGSGGGGAGAHVGGSAHLGGGGGHGGGGGGGSVGDALVVLAVVAIVIGVAIGVGYAGGEALRFDGYAQMAPEQPVHLQDGFGQKRELPLAALSPADVAETVEAKVMDDEGYGIDRLDRVPLDRRGLTFKLDSGETTFGLGPASFYGPTATMQLGYFFTRQVGLLMNVALGGSTDDQGMIVTRHTFNLELQDLPLANGRWHAGWYADAGLALAGLTSSNLASGPAAGGGALVEMDLTSRMALTLRAGANLARIDQAWSPAGSLAVGVALY